MCPSMEPSPPRPEESIWGMGEIIPKLPKSVCCVSVCTRRQHRQQRPNPILDISFIMRRGFCVPRVTSFLSSRRATSLPAFGERFFRRFCVLCFFSISLHPSHSIDDDQRGNCGITISLHICPKTANSGRDVLGCGV